MYIAHLENLVEEESKEATIDDAARRILKQNLN
jgi:hypothetical protein